MLPAKLIATLFGVTFILVGLLGFVPNPIVAPDGLFAVNTMHNLVHILTGAGFLAGGHLGYARQTIIGIGVAYVAVTIIGFLTTGNMLLGLVHINEADRWLHAALAVAILAAGYVTTDVKTASAS
ncbi:MAG: DUF4383 domain-containing protein [Hyphomicrobiales bacterium]|nr:DUF4383 domain-containing protein [Hyphomicrobiales bacterium]